MLDEGLLVGGCRVGLLNEWLLNGGCSVCLLNKRLLDGVGLSDNRLGDVLGGVLLLDDGLLDNCLSLLHVVGWVAQDVLLLNGLVFHPLGDPFYWHVLDLLLLDHVGDVLNVVLDHLVVRNLPGHWHLHLSPQLFVLDI